MICAPGACIHQWSRPASSGCSRCLRCSTGAAAGGCPRATRFSLGDPIGTYYTARVLEHGGDVLIASRFWDDDGRFLGALSDPAPVRWDDDGPTVDPADLGT